jgi:hypothetical protein
MPFPVKAIQVDGGSEFMAEFEVAYQTNYIVLYVLPPRSQQMNGAVERSNSAWDASSTKPMTSHQALNSSTPSSTAICTSTTIIGPREPLPE